METILADIGGTHARFALAAPEGIVRMEKIRAEECASLGEALALYCEKIGVKNGSAVFIATAARQCDDGMWRFTNRNPWVISIDELKRSGWSVNAVVNDFSASARGVLSLPPEKLVALREGVWKDSLPRAVLGPGTGLGLAYGVPLSGGGWHVQETFGGHMLAAVLTQEQHDILKQVGTLNDRPPVPEDVASGRGLPVLYRAVCMKAGDAPQWDSVESILKNHRDEHVLHTLRLFHEFLGLFAHNALVAGHAFGGLYLDGGLVQALHREKLFDFSSFATGLNPPVAPVVRAALETTSVYLVDDPFVALRGLREMMDDDV